MAGHTLTIRSLRLAWILLIVAHSAACGDESGQPITDTPTGPPAAGDDGAACVAAEECFGGVCLTELENGLPGGYCTSYACEDQGCHGGQCVVDSMGATACVDVCEADADCRGGYRCQERGAISVCDAGEVSPEVGESPGGACVSGCEVGDPVRVDCGFTPSREVQSGLFQFGLPYQLTSGVHGFVLSIWADDDPTKINAISVRNRADQVLYLKGADSALNVTSFVENTLVALTFPFAPRNADFARVDGGLLQVQAEAESLCIARTEGLEGSEITVNVYLAGAGGLSADSIGEDPDVVRAIAEIGRLLSLVDIDVKSVSVHTMPDEVVQAYRIVRQQEDIGQLLSQTDKAIAVEDEDPEDPLALNIVLVDDIALADGSETIGKAGLVPGPAGLNGTHASGIVVETTALRTMPEYLGLIIVHESAHFLGLRHTSEVFLDNFTFGRTDPLDDTPECPDVPALQETCPDYRNLMFPLAPTERSRSTVEVSAEQGWVLRNNPLVR